MQSSLSRPADRYSPLYFLASLGAGGLVVTFFMYLYFWVQHPAQAVPVFEDIAAAFNTGGLAQQAAIAVAMIGIAFFAVLNIKSLIWNLRQYSAYRGTDAYRQLTATNAHSQVLAMPLALAMSVNVGFMLGLVFVPQLWSIVEYLFPFAMIAFGAIGVLAFRQLADFLGRVLTKGGVFDVTAHNSFAQLLPGFALSMVAVGFAAPAAMSVNPVTVGISLIGSVFFATTSLIYLVIAAITGFNSMLHYGTAKEAGPTLMIIAPIMTVLGITTLRQDHGMHTTFGAPTNDVETMLFLTTLFSVQIVFLMLGMLVLRRQGYFRQFLFGTDNSAGAYALVCPGVGTSVLIQFWLNKGLVGAGMVAKFGATYWAIAAVAVALQLAMIWLVLHLNRRHFGHTAIKRAVPAE